MGTRSLMSHITLLISLFFSCGLANASIERCNNLTKQEVISIINNDFIHNRAPVWTDNMMNNIGTKKPKLIFSKNVMLSPDIYGFPFEAIGPQNKLKLIGLYDCRTGKIEYSKE